MVLIKIIKNYSRDDKCEMFVDFNIQHNCKGGVINPTCIFGDENNVKSSVVPMHWERRLPM